MYTQTKFSKRKIDLNPKIKSIQSLPKCPQNWTNPTISNQQSTNPQPNKNNKNTASTIPTRTPKQTHSNNKPTLQPTTAASQPPIGTTRPRQIRPTEGASILAREREKHHIEPKRETHWFERGAWGIWVWVWAKSRDKESSRRLSTKIEGERRKGKNGAIETERPIWGRKRKRNKYKQNHTQI